MGPCITDPTFLYKFCDEKTFHVVPDILNHINRTTPL